ncbi:MAG: MinD/ParA family protein [Candidatus Omnitrophota bacterium]
MKPKIADQAEKLRQLAAQEEGGFSPGGAAVAALEEPSGAEAAPMPNDKPSLPAEMEEKRSLSPDAPASATKKEKTKTLSSADSKKRERSESPSGKPPIVETSINVARGEAEALAAEAPSAAEAVAILDEMKETEAAPAPPESGKVTELLSARRFLMDGHTRVIAVTGGKGGVGKSNIACNLGIAMAQMRKRVLLLDADLSLANVDILLGLTPRLNLSHVLSGEKKLDEVMMAGPAGMNIIPGGSGLEEFCNLPLPEMERIFDAFAGLDPAPDILIIDTAAGIHPNVLQFLLAANQVLVVTTPEPPAYTDAYALIKTLVRHDPGKEIGVAVNMANDAREANEVVKLMLQICRQMLRVGFSNMGFIPRDPHVMKAVRHQQPFLIQSPNSPAAKAVRNMAATALQSGSNAAAKGLKGFFRRLFSQAPPTKAAANS